MADEEYTDEEIERFLNRITKPMFVWRMARAMVGHKNGAEIRHGNALAEIRTELYGLLTRAENS